MRREVEINGRVHQIAIRSEGRGVVVSIDDRERVVDAARVDPFTWSLIVDGISREVTVVPSEPGHLSVRVGDAVAAVAVGGRRRGRGRHAGIVAGSGGQRLTAPMPGKVVRVLVRQGEIVAARQPIVVVEAMKMENELRASVGGVVSEVNVESGQSVEVGALLAVIVTD